DADAASGDAELAPGVGRSDLQDPRARREGGAGYGVERREHEVVGGDVRDVRVLGEIQNFAPSKPRRGTRDDRERSSGLAASATHRRHGTIGTVTAPLWRAGAHDDCEIVLGMRLR